MAKTDLYPRFALVGSIGVVSSDTNQSDLGDLFDADSIAYNFGPSASWNVFNYGRLKNRVRVQDARLEELIVNYQNTVLQAAREVEDGLSSYFGSRKQSEYLADSVKAAQRSVDLALLQYREGAVDYQRVLDTQQTRLRLQDSLYHGSRRGDRWFDRGVQGAGRWLGNPCRQAVCPRGSPAADERTYRLGASARRGRTGGVARATTNRNGAACPQSARSGSGHAARARRRLVSCGIAVFWRSV